MPRTNVFVTGGTGYIGRRLIPRLVTRGYDVRALIRSGSEQKVPPGCTPIVGNVLDRTAYTSSITRDSIVVQLVGTPKPSPAKAAQFEAVDFVSARECIAAATAARACHFIYVSVAQPAPIMRAYVNVRARGEALLRESGLPHTILRPWYVLGPGHRWAYGLYPLYWVAALVPWLREGAHRCGMVTLEQMLRALEWSVSTAGGDSRLLEVPEIRIAQTRTA
jgi:uncharacterized protein YbjT (DUF2867 family)